MTISKCGRGHDLVGRNRKVWDSRGTQAPRVSCVACVRAGRLYTSEGEEAVARHADDIYQQLMPKPRTKYSSSPVETGLHKVKYGSKWFRTEEGRDLYRENENERRRVVRAGFEYTPDGIGRYRQFKADADQATKLRKEREAQERVERDELREELGLHPKAHTTRAQARFGEVTPVGTTAEQRLALIKSLYDDKTNTLADILIKTRQIVGADIETLKGRN